MTGTWKCTGWEWPTSFSHGKITVTNSILWLITVICALQSYKLSFFTIWDWLLANSGKPMQLLTGVLWSLTREDKSTAAVVCCHPSVIFSSKGSQSIWTSEAEEAAKPHGSDFCLCCGFWSSPWEKKKSSSRSGTINILFLIKWPSECASYEL